MYAFNATHYLQIDQDEDAESPLDFDNLGTLVQLEARRGYNMGTTDRTATSTEQEAIQRGGSILLARYMRATGEASHLLAIYPRGNGGGYVAYEPDDSTGCVGFIYTTPARIAELGAPEESVLPQLRAEVETYSQWAEGDVYGFTLSTIRTDLLEAHGFDSIEDVRESERHLFLEHVDSCWGFYGSDPKTNGMADHLTPEYADLLESLS